MLDIPFKAVAVDMDGTFVNSDNTYDHDRFGKILERLRAKGAHFIVASGRPFPLLKKNFSEFLDKIDLICDNGGILVRDNKIIKTTTFSKEISQKLIHFLLSNYPMASIIVCGLENSYILPGASNEFKKFMNYYYPDAVFIKNPKDIPQDDLIDKITIWDPADPKEIENIFNENNKEKIHATSSGFNCTDIIPEGINKANSLKYFLDYFNLTPDQLIAFGDGMNDLEMMKLAGYSYAMENADAELKKIAKFEAPSNNESGVLVVLEKYLDELNHK